MEKQMSENEKKIDLSEIPTGARFRSKLLVERFFPKKIIKKHIILIQ